MDSEIIQKLRKDQALIRLPDGQEAVHVTLEFPGTIPEPTRAARKRWLCEHFQDVVSDLEREGFGLTTQALAGEISTSGQSLRATVPVNQLEQLRQHLEHRAHKVGISTRHQAQAGL